MTLAVDPKVLACPKCGEPRANHTHVPGLQDLWRTQPTKNELMNELVARLRELR